MTTNQPSWFSLWAIRHSKAFGLSDLELKSILSWESALSGCYSSEELHAATDSILREPMRLAGIVGKTMEKHLISIRTAIHDRRTIKTQTERDNLEERGTCVLCNGSGRVIVPNLACIRAGEWRPLKKARGAPCYYTYAVLCSCALGHWFAGHTDNQMTLDFYQQANPRWQIQMQQRAAEQKSEADTAALAAGEVTVSQVIADTARRFAACQ